MEIQDRLVNYNKDLKFENFRVLVKLKPNERSLEEEKKRFLEIMSSFMDKINLQPRQYNGRPRFHLNDIFKSLLVMSYNGMSYRRAESDLLELKEKGLIQNIPKRSTLNKYMLLEDTKKAIEKLIQLSSMFFIESEDTLILDSTWLATNMYVGGHKRVYDKAKTPLERVRKLHISCLKNSKVICCAKASEGRISDRIYFKELIHTPIKNGFLIKYVLADAGYTSRDHYAFCHDLNIENTFIDFTKRCSLKKPKSPTWRNQLKMFHENPEKWHDSYRFRVIVEGVFSAIKRKHLNYIRARNGTSQDVELLLKCLVYNLTIIGKYF